MIYTLNSSARNKTPSKYVDNVKCIVESSMIDYNMSYTQYFPKGYVYQSQADFQHHIRTIYGKRDLYLTVIARWALRDTKNVRLNNATITEGVRPSAFGTRESDKASGYPSSTHSPSVYFGEHHTISQPQLIYLRKHCD